MFSSIAIDWKGKHLTGEQSLVVQRAAAQFPEDDMQAALEFTHELCEGLITCKGRKTIGTFTGVVFSAYLGEYKGQPWTYDFLLVDGFGRMQLPDDHPHSLISSTESGAPSVTIIDAKRAAKVRVSKMRRH